ncbi:hypothetical protein EBZ80_10615 [bacterium]|nr:hypothetical protein [bacterium]
MRGTSQQRLLNYRIVGAWLLFVAIASWFGVGWIQADEHSRVLEAAHKVAYGFASLPWEFDDRNPIVSMLIGVIFSPLLMITRFYGASGLTEAFILRFVFGLIASTRLLALMRCFHKTGLRQDRTWIYLLISCFTVYGPLFFCRTSQENLAATTLLWAYAIHFDVIDPAASRESRGLDTFLFGALLALTATFRPQAGVAAAGLGLYALWKRGPGVIPLSAAGLFAGLLPGALVDTYYTGIPFRPAWNYLVYALGNEDGGQVWGVSPWWWYIPQYFDSWYPPVSVLAVVPVAIALWNVPSLAVTILPFTIVHCVLGHKETRYFVPMIGFMHLATFAGFEAMERLWPQTLSRFGSTFYRPARYYLLCLVALTLATCFLPLNSSPWMYDRLRQGISSGRISRYTQLADSMSGVMQFYVKQGERVPGPLGNLKAATRLVSSGREYVQGWVAGQDMDVSLYRPIAAACRVDYVSLPEFVRSIFERIEKSPARKKLNMIFYCESPFTIPAQENPSDAKKARS